jgi:hypothetical protein
MSFDNANYPINDSGRNANFVSKQHDGGQNTAWDPYESLSSGSHAGKTGQGATAWDPYENLTGSFAGKGGQSNDAVWDPYELLKSGGLKPSTSDALDNFLKDDGKSGKDSTYLSKLGFNTPDLTGFDQESPNHDGSLWHSFKHLFTKDQTNEDVIRSTLEKQMAKDPKYQDEEKAYKEYQSKLLGWETQANMNPGPMPQPPDMPMHDQLERQVKQAEKEISRQVERDMSPADRKRLQGQMNQYEKDYDDATRIHNPMGTGEGFRPLPTPGNAVRDYYDRIGTATEKWVNNQNQGD